MSTQPGTPGIDVERAISAVQFPVGVFRTDTAGRCYAVNPRWCELSGLTEAESMGLGWLQAIHPDDRERVFREQSIHMAEGRNLRVEFRIAQPNGRIVWVLSQAVASMDVNGKIEGFMGTITDITARVQAEAALRESEERFRNLVELSPDFICIHRAGVMHYVNAAGLRMMNAEKPEDLVGHHILEFVLREHQEAAVARMSEIQKGEAIPLAEMEVRRCDGEVIWIETVAGTTIWGGQPAVQLVARDVTERRHTEQTYRGVVEGVRDALWVFDRHADGQWRTSFVNEHYVRASRLQSAQEILGKSVRELAAEGMSTLEDAIRTEERCALAAESDGPMEFENQLTWNGVSAYIVTTITPVRNPHGVCTQLICWSRDVSRRRAREQALAESEANYRAVVEGTSDAVWVMDKDPDGDYRVNMANPRTRDLLGLTPSDVVGKTVTEFLEPAAAELALRRYRQAEATGETIEYEHVAERDGVHTEVVTHLTPLYDENGRCYRIIGSARDVTDRRRAEAALLQSQKLESLGVLAGGIAHDFNNLLTTILGNLYLLDSELPQDSPLRAYTGDSRIAGERGADLVKRLLGFSRPGIHAQEFVSLASLVQETAGLLQRALGPGVDLQVVPPDPAAIVTGEFSSLQQVLVNLLFNARDAMPDGGTIQVSHNLCTIGVDSIWGGRGLAPGEYHEILIVDSGTGMSRDVMQRIFDPFFTTKGVGKGTGLGLSTSFSIVRAHGGWLEAESQEGTGSTFRMLLPAT